MQKISFCLDDICEIFGSSDVTERYFSIFHNSQYVRLLHRCWGPIWHFGQFLTLSSATDYWNFHSQVDSTTKILKLSILWVTNTLVIIAPTRIAVSDDSSKPSKMLKQQNRWIDIVFNYRWNELYGFEHK